MKKTQLKDSVRNIKKQIVSFISIIVIAALGVSTFLGIEFSVRALRGNLSRLYDEQNFRDIEAVSTLLFTKNDLDDIKAAEGVADAEAVRYTEAKTQFADARENAAVISLTERINKPITVEGRLPSGAAECAVEIQLADSLGLKAGDEIRLLDPAGNAA